MKKLVVLITLAATAVGYSQSTLGSVSFVTRAGSAPNYIVNAPITYGAGGPVAAGLKPSFSGAPAGTYVTDGIYTFGGPNARAALYAVAGEDPSKLTDQIITPNVPFKPYTGATGGFWGYVDALYSGGTTDRKVPGTAPAGTDPLVDPNPQKAVCQIRAWDTGTAVANDMTYEQAVLMIQQNGKGYYGVGNVFVNGLGGGAVASAYLSGATAFTINWVPEPSIIGLGILGAIAGMVVFRRRQ